MRKGILPAMILLLALAIPVVGLAAKEEMIVFKGGQKAVVVENKIYFLDTAGKRYFASPGKYQTPDGKTIIVIDKNGNFRGMHVQR